MNLLKKVFIASLLFSITVYSSEQKKQNKIEGLKIEISQLKEKRETLFTTLNKEFTKSKSIPSNLLTLGALAFPWMISFSTNPSWKTALPMLPYLLIIGSSLPWPSSSYNETIASLLPLEELIKTKKSKLKKLQNTDE